MFNILEALHKGSPTLAIIHGFFDESGKFADHAVVAFCGVVSNSEDFNKFQLHWNRLLRTTGLEVLTMKEALKHKRPLSSTLPAVGLVERTKVLMEFAQCIREHLEMIVIQTIDVAAFHAMTDNARGIIGDDPNYAAFGRGVMEVLRYMRDADTLSLFCDDEEKAALPMYRFYRKIKNQYPGARKRLCSITFADDEVYVPLQAADMVASMARHEGRHEFFGEENEYQPIYDLLSKPHEALKSISVVAMYGKNNFDGFSAGIDEIRRKYGQALPSWTK